MKRIAYVWIAGMILAGMMASFASPQSSTPQEQPLGDYARAVRKDKKPASAKQFDNDNLPAQDKLSVVGNAVAAGDEKSQTAANGGQDTGSAQQEAAGKPPPGPAGGEEEKPT